MKSKVVDIILPLLGAAAILFIPFGREVLIYRAVLSPETLKIEENIISMSVEHTSQADDYLARNGRLYLKFQSTRSSLLLVTYLNNYQWSPEKLEKLKMYHPELDGLWFDSKSGVYWLDW